MYQGVNGTGHVVIKEATQEQVNEFKANPAYNFVRFIPIADVEKVEAPAEVENVPEPLTNKHSDGKDHANGRSRRKTNRGK